MTLSLLVHRAHDPRSAAPISIGAAGSPGVPPGDGSGGETPPEPAVPIRIGTALPLRRFLVPTRGNRAVEAAHGPELMTCDVWQSQRDCGPKPRVAPKAFGATLGQPWKTPPQSQRGCGQIGRRAVSGPQPRWGWRQLVAVTQGSAGGATLGFVPESLWDSGREPFRAELDRGRSAGLQPGSLERTSFSSSSSSSNFPAFDYEHGHEDEHEKDVAAADPTKLLNHR